jgi:hypothetical protein
MRAAPSLQVSKLLKQLAPPLVILLLLERIAHLEAKNHTWTRGGLLVLGVALLGFAWTGQALRAGLLTIALYVAIRGFSELKFHFLEQPLRAQDLADVNPAEVFELSRNYPLYAVLVIAALLLILVLTWRWSAKEARQWPRRLIALTTAVMSLNMLFGELKAAGVTASAPESACLLTLIATFFQAPPSFESSLPPQPHEPGIQCPAHPPNVFLVLEESTFMPSGTASYGVDMQFFDGNVFAGPMRVHVIGGTTHLSEFAWITGLPHTALSGENTFPQVPLQGRIHRTLPELLKACGYTTSVLYPSGRHFRNSARWYSSVGFDYLLSGDDMHIEDWRTRDEVYFRRALEHLATLPADKPHFVYVLTINQHGPHAPSDRRKDYMTRLAQSAADMKTLSDTLQRAAQAPHARPWVLSWFGDHRTAIEMDGPERWMTWAVMSRFPTPSTDAAATSKDTAPVDIANFNRLLQREIGVAWPTLAKVQDKFLTACRADFDACSKANRDELIREYIDTGGFIKAPASDRSRQTALTQVK